MCKGCFSMNIVASAVCMETHPAVIVRFKIFPYLASMWEGGRENKV